MTQGLGIVRKIGWEEGPTMPRRFVAVIEFPDGPPDLPSDVVWKSLPVQLSVAAEIPVTPPPSSASPEGAPQ